MQNNQVSYKNCVHSMIVNYITRKIWISLCLNNIFWNLLFNRKKEVARELYVFLKILFVT